MGSVPILTSRKTRGRSDVLAMMETQIYYSMRSKREVKAYVTDFECCDAKIERSAWIGRQLSKAGLCLPASHVGCGSSAR